MKIITSMLLGSISTLLCATQSGPALAEESGTGVHLVVVDVANQFEQQVGTHGAEDADETAAASVTPRSRVSVDEVFAVGGAHG